MLEKNIPSATQKGTQSESVEQAQSTEGLKF